MSLRLALRWLTSQPAATTVVVLTLAVAIASTTVIYSAIDLVWGFIPVVNRAGLVYVTSTDTRVLQAQGTTQSVVLRTPVSVPILPTTSRVPRPSMNWPASRWAPSP